MNRTEEQHQDKDHKFITPVSMPCTQEQFERDLKGPLEEMGYDLVGLEGQPQRQTVVFAHTKMDMHVVGLCYVNSIMHQSISICIDFNPEHFLALAARTDNPEGIPGEWWRDITNGRLTKGEANESHGPFHVKATVSEINRHFEGIVMDDINSNPSDTQIENAEFWCTHCIDGVIPGIISTLCPKCIQIINEQICDLAKPPLNIKGTFNSLNTVKETPDQLYRLKDEIAKTLSNWQNVGMVIGFDPNHEDLKSVWNDKGYSEKALEKVEPEKQIKYEVHRDGKFSLLKVNCGCNPWEEQDRKEIEHFINGEYDQIDKLNTFLNDSRR